MLNKDSSYIAEDFVCPHSGRRSAIMLAYRLVKLIEKHADSLASELYDRVYHSPLLPGYKNVPEEELKTYVQEIYRHLGDWLLGNNQREIEIRYKQIGARRAGQDIPFHELLWAIVLTKETLWEYMREESAGQRPAEVYGELEILQVLDQFFDHAQYCAAIGYEQAAETRGGHHLAN